MNASKSTPPSSTVPLSDQWSHCHLKLVQNSVLGLAFGPPWNHPRKPVSFLFYYVKFLPKQHFWPSLVLNLNSDSINVKGIIVLWTCKVLHTFTLLLSSGRIALAKPTLRVEKLPPLRIIQKNIQQQWKKCQKRYQYILNNGDVIRIRKYFQGKSFHLHEWKTNQFHCCIVTLCLKECGKDAEGQGSNNRKYGKSKTLGGPLSNHSHTTQFLTSFTWGGLVFAPK